MKDYNLDGDENKKAVMGTFSYMNQDGVPYARLNAAHGFVPYVEKNDNQAVNTDSDKATSSYLDMDFDIESDRFDNIGKGFRALRENDLSANTATNQKLSENSDSDAQADTGLDLGLGLDLDLDENGDTDIDVDEKQAPAINNVTDDDDDDDDEPEEAQSKTRMELYDWLQCIVSAIICGIFIFVFVGRTIGVDGSSMMQTLHNNDRVIMSNLFYTPKQGDIVVFQTSTDSFGGTPLVKRVIAVAGQTIDIDFQSGDVYIDGVVREEPYINEPTHSRLNFTGPVTVPEGFIFVMGDNRNHSSDSRDARVGLVDTRYILGRVLIVAIPGADKDSPRDWSRLGATH